MNRIALLTPYTPLVTQALSDALSASGIKISRTGYFDIEDDFKVGRVDSTSLFNAIIALGSHKDCEGVFVSCTSLRVTNIILKAERHLGKPVISSNQALAWHLLRLSGVDQELTHFGCLFSQGLPRQ